LYENKKINIMNKKNKKYENRIIIYYLLIYFNIIIFIYNNYLLFINYQYSMEMIELVTKVMNGTLL